MKEVLANDYSLSSFSTVVPPSPESLSLVLGNQLALCQNPLPLETELVTAGPRLEPKVCLDVEKS